VLWLQSLHPVIGSSTITLIHDHNIFITKTDDNGFWEITTTRETQDGIELAYWSNKDPNLFSIGIEAPDKQNILIQDIIIDDNISGREINIQLNDMNENPIEEAPQILIPF